MKLLVVIAVCIVSAMAVPKAELMTALRRVLNEKRQEGTSPEPDVLPPVGIDGLRMLDWTVMDMLDEGCIRRGSREGPSRPPPPMTTEAPEDNPERQLLNALKRMMGEGPESMPSHPRVGKLVKALDIFCEALMERLDGEEGEEGGQEEVVTNEP